MIRYRIPPLRRWPHMAGLLARCGVLQAGSGGAASWRARPSRRCAGRCAFAN